MRGGKASVEGTFPERYREEKILCKGVPQEFDMLSLFPQFQHPTHQSTYAKQRQMQNPQENLRTQGDLFRESNYHNKTQVKRLMIACGFYNSRENLHNQQMKHHGSLLPKDERFGRERIKKQQGYCMKNRKISRDCHLNGILWPLIQRFLRKFRWEAKIRLMSHQRKV